MREITFRGKAKSGEWRYGFLFLSAKGKAYIITEICDVDGELYPVWYEVDPKTIGQYTGLKDENGKEIYEGDIFTRGRKFFYVVVFHGGGFKLKLLKGGFEDMIPLSCVAKHGEVIGNIYENPELLEEVKELKS